MAPSSSGAATCNQRGLTLNAQTQALSKGATKPAPTSAYGSEGSKPRDLLGTILSSLDDAKAEDITHIDIAGKSAVADHLVITSGRSHRHVNAVSDRLLRDLKNGGYGSPRVEGMPACDWVLMDTGDVIVHIFRPEVRDFYNLEKMWLQVANGEAGDNPLDA
jgi:ribosome-associated protein